MSPSPEASDNAEVEAVVVAVVPAVLVVPVEVVLVEHRRQQAPEQHPLRPLDSPDRKRMLERLLRRHRPRFLHASMCT